MHAMRTSVRRTLFTGVLLLGAVLSSPLPRPKPAYDARLSSLELAIIKCIVETVPGVTKGGGGSYDWSVVQSRSKELQGAEIEVVQVGQREPDFTGRSGGAYPDDWNIVRSVSSQLATGEDGLASGPPDARGGLSDDWAIVKSISTELHLDVEQSPADNETPNEQEPIGGLEMHVEAMFPVNQPTSSGEGTTGELFPIDVRSFSSGPASGNVMDVQQSYTHSDDYMGRGNVDGSNEMYQQKSFETGQQISGVQHNAGGAIGWSIVRSLSSEQEPLSADIMSTAGSQQTISTSGTQNEKGDTDSYNLVQPISSELQPADNEAEEIPASLTELFPPPLDETGGAWNSPPTEGAQPSEILSAETDESSPLESQEPCETGHKRIKNECRKVYTFQLKSHLR